MLRQRLVSFLAFICIAQLGVVATRHFWLNSTEWESQTPVSAQPNSALMSDPQYQPSKSTRSADSPRASMKALSTLPTKEAGPAKDRRDLLTAPHQPPTRDPFVPFFSIRGDKSGEARTSLTSYDVSELRLAAILGDSDGQRSASLESADGRSFIVKLGSAVGAANGRVTAITPKKVVISQPKPGSVDMEDYELTLRTINHPQ